jgi:dipeptidyl-peptidase III
MDEDTLKHYLANDPPTIVPLEIKPHFESLSEQEKLYAHYISVYLAFKFWI